MFMLCGEKDALEIHSPKFGGKVAEIQTVVGRQCWVSRSYHHRPDQGNKGETLPEFRVVAR